MVTIEETVSWAQLEQMIRATPLLHEQSGQIILPYEAAEISLREVSYTEVAPTSLYVLRENLAIQARIIDDLATWGYHPLELEGGLILRNSEGGSVGLVPPIVEQTDEEGCYILDGAHRTSVGRWQGRTSFVAIHISGIRRDCPGYAYPNDWNDIRIVEDVPTDPAQKKRYRDDYRALYRDFSLLNGSHLREA
jgi:hypothetical protein